MGSYYMATIVNNKNEGKMYDTHALGNGLKLMEHSYIGNNYVNYVLSLLEGKENRLVWLCDYHNPDENTKLTWEKCVEETEYDKSVRIEDDKYYVINHTLNVYIDIKKLDQLEEDNGWTIHPIPILCNSDTQSQGGGDFHKEDSRRASWCEHYIEVTLDKPSDTFKDVTEDCLFTE